MRNCGSHHLITMCSGDLPRHWRGRGKRAALPSSPRPFSPRARRAIADLPLSSCRIAGSGVPLSAEARKSRCIAPPLQLVHLQFVEMAQAMAAAALAPVAGLGTSSLSMRASRSKVQLTSAFVQRASVSTAPRFENVNSMSRVTCFNRDWLRKDLSVIGFGLIGWLAPSSIPVIKGNSLTGLFFSSIGPELAHWPTGPGLTSPFWLWMITWHFGLFVVLTFGQIGFKGRKDGLF